jgi:hypothetical protein
MSFLGSSGFSAAPVKRAISIGCESTCVSFTVPIFLQQNGSFSMLCGGCTAAGGGNGTRNPTFMSARAAKQLHCDRCLPDLGVTE